MVERIKGQRGDDKAKSPPIPPSGGGGSIDTHPILIHAEKPTDPTPVPPAAKPALDPKNIKTLEEAYAFFIEAYRNKPVEFVENVLQAKPLPWQRDFLTSLARGNDASACVPGMGWGNRRYVLGP